MKSECHTCVNCKKDKMDRYYCVIFSCMDRAYTNETGKCGCYNYETLTCTVCGYPVDVSKEYWGYDKSRKNAVCLSCLQDDYIPDRRSE